ncbi:POTRA domain-containing protein [Enterobacter cancerogenus]|uniref:POTRA domain-containing protein n=1 Tax=Enterobacter cancerogenus TaxID=69218 RepID=UPI0034D2FB1D
MSVKVKIIQVLAGIALLTSGTAQAVPLSPADRNTIQQQQQQLLQENQRQREELERSVVLPGSAKPVNVPSTQGACFVISQIELSGATLFSTSAKKSLIAPWVNQCLDIARLNTLTNAISDWYISRGYITSRRCRHQHLGERQ